MIEELKEVISKVEQLKDDEQRKIAKMIDEEIKWDTTLLDSQNELNKLAQDALNEHQSGKTKQADW